MIRNKALVHKIFKEDFKIILGIKIKIFFTSIKA